MANTRVTETVWWRSAPRAAVGAMAVLVTLLALLQPAAASPSGASEEPDAPAAAGSISGKITDPGGNPVEGVLVVADQGSGGLDLTDVDGIYTIGGLAAGDHIILVPNGKYPLAPRWYDGSYDPASATPVPVGEGEDVSGIDLQLELFATVTGTARDANGEVINSAIVMAIPDAGPTWGGYAHGVNPDGTFVVDTLPITQRVGVQEGTAVPTCPEAWFDGTNSYWTATPIPVDSGKVTEGIDLTFDCGRVAGTVTNDWGDPLPGIGVQVLDAGTMTVVAEVTTDVAGVYSTERLAGGDYLVAFAPPPGSPYAPEWFEDAADAGSATVVGVGSSNTLGVGGKLSTVPQGFLRVTTEPALPVDITVDGIVRDGWGLNWLSMPVGTHEVCFEEIEGWTGPPCETVEVLADTTTEVAGKYQERGYLRVTTAPALPSTIFVDGAPMNEWGVWTDLDPGTYEVCFGAVDGWAPPGCKDVDVTAGVTTELEGPFEEDPGSVAPTDVGYLRVTTSPPVGAKIIVDGVPRDSWGLNWLKVPEGEHEVCFGPVPNTVTPPCETVATEVGQTVEVVGEYEIEGFLRVVSSPAVPAVITVDGWPANAWGVWRSIPAGDHLVCFWPLEGLTAPTCQTATVTADVLTEITGVYT